MLCLVGGMDGAVAGNKHDFEAESFRLGGAGGSIRWEAGKLGRQEAGRPECQKADG